MDTMLLSKKIQYLLNRIGEGVINPVAYDTAIVGWIGRTDNKSEPQFPQCIEWLRRHQLPDGSWGTQRPCNPYGNVVSTLAAIIAIAKWSDSETDLIAVTKGEKAVNALAKRIRQEEEEYETIGYEILLPMLLTEAKSLGLRVESEDLEMKNENLFKEKFELILSHHCKYGWTRKHSFWYSLEMVFGLKDISYVMAFNLTSQVVEHNGSVCGSPSASAFYLMTNRCDRSATKTYHYLNQLVCANSGGMPALSPSDSFELSWSLSAMLMAGFPSDHPFLKPALDKLLFIWYQFNGYVGCSSCLPPDIDAISAFAYVLNTSKICHKLDSLAKMIKFFNNDYFVCFEGERNASISVNITALIALKTFPSDPRIAAITSKVVQWLKTRIDGRKMLFTDKWHVSPFYTTSRAVFAFHGIDDQLMHNCVQQLLSHQNPDYGWGISDSTLEETALVTMALCYWLRSCPEQRNSRHLKIMRSIDQFFNGFNGEPYVELWIAKSLYCPKLVVDMFVCSAQYSLRQLLMSLKF